MTSQISSEISRKCEQKISLNNFIAKLITSPQLRKLILILYLCELKVNRPSGRCFRTGYNDEEYLESGGYPAVEKAIEGESQNRDDMSCAS